MIVANTLGQLLPRALSRVSLPFAAAFDRLGNARWYNYPLGRAPRGSREEYLRLAEETAAQRFPQIDAFEAARGYAVSAEWLDQLALHTQITVKRSELCYQHGRVLYAVVRDYLARHPGRPVHILETGTARGFSALCMARAIADGGAAGTIVTFDVLPHTVPMYWNCVDDFEGPHSRAELLRRWHDLVEAHILFHQGDTLREIPKLHQSRIHLAYLDGQHTYQHVLEEFGHVEPRQQSGDVVVFDDYSERSFPGVVRAVDELCARHGYEPEVIRISPTRAYVVATRR
jgi:predicted O-methyltransferase YrrM